MQLFVRQTAYTHFYAHIRSYPAPFVQLEWQSKCSIVVIARILLRPVLHRLDLSHPHRKAI